MSGDTGDAILIEFEGIEKLITGLTSKSTWSDLTYALLTKRYHEARGGGARGGANVPMSTPLEALRNYAIFDRYGECRQLPSRSRVLKMLHNKLPDINEDAQFSCYRVNTPFRRGCHDDDTASNASANSGSQRRIHWRRHHVPALTPTMTPATTSAMAPATTNTMTRAKARPVTPANLRINEPSCDHAHLSQELRRKDGIIDAQLASLQPLQSDIEMYRQGFRTNGQDVYDQREIDTLLKRQQGISHDLQIAQSEILRTTQLLSVERQPLPIEENLKQSSDCQLRDYSLFLASELDKFDRRRIDQDHQILRNRQCIDDLVNCISSRSRQLQAESASSQTDQSSQPALANQTLPPHLICSTSNQVNRSQECNHSGSDCSSMQYCGHTSGDTGYSDSQSNTPLDGLHVGGAGGSSGDIVLGGLDLGRVVTAGTGGAGAGAGVEVMGDYSSKRPGYHINAPNAPLCRSSNRPPPPPYHYQDGSTNCHPPEYASSQSRGHSATSAPIAYYTPRKAATGLDDLDYTGSRPPHWNSPPGISSIYRISSECPSASRGDLRHPRTLPPSTRDGSTPLDSQPPPPPPPLPCRAKPMPPGSTIPNRQAKSFHRSDSSAESSQAGDPGVARRPQQLPRKRFYETTC